MRAEESLSRQVPADPETEDVTDLFVCKRPTISTCLDSVRFGRATLSSTGYMCEQLSLNWLVSTFVYFVVIIENMEFSERQ
jgi:hypothetical protein